MTNIQFRAFAGQCWGEDLIRTRLGAIARLPRTNGQCRVHWFRKDLSYPHATWGNRLYNVGVIRRTCLGYDNYAARDTLRQLYPIVHSDSALYSLFLQAVLNFEAITGISVGIPYTFVSDEVPLTTVIGTPPIVSDPVIVSGPTTVVHEVCVDTGPRVVPVPIYYPPLYCPPPPVRRNFWSSRPAVTTFPSHHPTSLGGRVPVGTGHTGFARPAAPYVPPRPAAPMRVPVGTGNVRPAPAPMRAPTWSAPSRNVSAGTRNFSSATAFTRAPTVNFRPPAQRCNAPSSLNPGRVAVGGARGFRR